MVRQIIGWAAFIALIGILSWSLFTTAGRASVQDSRDREAATQKAIDAGREAERQTFCNEYKKSFPTADDAPRAYQHCY